MISTAEEATVSGSPDVRSVLVGYDESPASEQALRWGVEEAQLRDLPLTVCHAWHWPYPFRPPEADTLKTLRGMAAVVADEGVRKAHSMAEGLDIRWRLEQGFPPAMLLMASREAGLVVLGSRGLGGFGDLTVGSVAVQVPAHATCPVIVVRSTATLPRRDGARVVVGVDGSPASEKALGFAFKEASLRDASLTVVCAWWDLGALPGPDRAPFVQPEVIRREAMTRFERAVAPWQLEYPKVPVETRFVVETPRRAVVDAAKDAALLVVGDRGVGSVPEMLLGPVTQGALHQAACPVAVVPAEATV